MNVYDYMEGFDRSFDQNEFDARLWEYVQDENFENSEEFEYFLREYGISGFHEFMKIIRMKRERGLL